MRLHIGCGDNYFAGWVHLDMNPLLPNVDALWHSSDGLPCATGTCEFIYSEHFLEHLSVAEGQQFLSECYRALRPGGVVRIAMPDLRESVAQYYENRWREQPWLEKYGYAWIQTGAEYLNIAMRDWGHQWLYDREELRRRMRDVGFTTIHDCDWGVSAVPELCQRETRRETTLICEATRT
jgi:predicted SAM-dependent methyltransferase